MDKHRKIKNASILGMSGNIFLLIIKVIGGYISNSYAMISEAFNSAGDIFSSFMTFIGNHIASKEADDDHNLGHGKAEYIFSLLISVSMILVSIDLIYNSIKSIFVPNSYNFSIYLIIICITTIIIKSLLYIHTHRIAKKYKNLLIEANAEDHRNDCVLALLNLTATICSYYGIYEVDGIVGTIISIWILVTGVKIFKQAYDVLMDKAIDENTKQKVFDIINKYPEIKKTNHFNSTPVGYQFQISLTIFVDGNLSTFESHDIANMLEKEISSLDEIYLTIIHVNPL